MGLSNAHKPLQIDRYSAIGGGASIEYHDTLNYFQGWKTIFPNAGGWVQYNKIELQKASKNMTVRLKTSKAGTATLILSNNKMQVKLPSTNGQWQEVKVAVKSVKKGVYDLKLIADSQMEIDWIKFD